MVKMSSQQPSPASSDGSTSPSSNEFQVISPPSSHFNGGTFSHLNDLHLSISQAVFDLSPEEIQTHLRDILKENVELKEALQQNNIAMREQFSRLLAWQSEVSAVQQQHKGKFEETRALVQRLHSENIDLQKQLKQQEASKREHEACPRNIEALQKQLTDLQHTYEETKLQKESLAIGETQLKDELADAYSNAKRLKEANSHLTVEKRDLMAINNELQAKLADFSSQAPSQAPSLVCSEPSSYVMVTSTLTKEASKCTEKPITPKMLTGEVKGIKELLVQLRSEQEKALMAEALMAEVIDERKKNSLMAKELAEANEKLSQVAGSSSDKISGSSNILHDLKESEVKFSMASTYLTRYKDRCCSLENWLGLYQDRLESLRSKDDELIDQLRVEVGNLRKTLVQEQSINHDDKKHLLEARQQFELLLKDYQELLKSWETYEKEQTSRGRQSEAYYELQVRSLLEQVDGLTAKLVSCEESLLAKEDDVRRLSKQVKAQMLESDRIPILQAQMEVYQTDFRAEREACKKLKQECDRLVQEVCELQSRNQQLLDELEVYQQSQFVQMQHSGSRRADCVDQRTLSRISAGSSAYGSSAGMEFDGGDAGRSNWSVGATANIRPSTSRPHTMRPVDTERTALRHMGVTPRRIPSQRQVSDRSSSPDDNVYYCPKCHLGFTEFQPLENHVNLCLDVDDPFVN